MDELFDVVTGLLEKCGFSAFGEFTAVDSLIHKDEYIGFYALKDCQLVGTAMGCTSKKLSAELDCCMSIRLMGKSCDHADVEEFTARCDDLYGKFIVDGGLLIRSMKLGKIYLSSPLNRLTRELTLNARICLEEDE